MAPIIVKCSIKSTQKFKVILSPSLRYIAINAKIGKIDKITSRINSVFVLFSTISNISFVVFSTEEMEIIRLDQGLQY